MNRGLSWLCGGLLVASSLSVQATVILDGKEWQQPADLLQTWDAGARDKHRVVVPVALTVLLQ